MPTQIIEEETIAPRTLAIDLDGTIAAYDGFRGVGVFGKPLPGAIDTLRRFKNDGWFIVVDTCRGEVPYIKKYLEMYQIPFDAINEHPFQPSTANPGKPIADYRIDDSAVYFNGDWGAVYEEVQNRERESIYSPLTAIKITGQYMYDPEKNLLLDMLNPMQEEGKPTDYPDPVYWGHPGKPKKKLLRVKYQRDE